MDTNLNICIPSDWWLLYWHTDIIHLILSLFLYFINTSAYYLYLKPLLIHSEQVKNILHSRKTIITENHIYFLAS